MGVKRYKPYTPSRRHMTSSDFSEITRKEPEKSLVVHLKSHAGRNNQGKITVRHRGGGHKKKYRIIDFKRLKDDIPATVKSVRDSSSIDSVMTTDVISCCEKARRPRRDTPASRARCMK